MEPTYRQRVESVYFKLLSETISKKSEETMDLKMLDMTRLKHCQLENNFEPTHIYTHTYIIYIGDSFKTQKLLMVFDRSSNYNFFKIFLVGGI